MFDQDKIARDTVQVMLNHLSHLFLRLSWGGPSHETNMDMMRWLESSPVREEVKLLVSVANGDVERSDMAVGETVETIQGVVELLFAAPGSNSYDIPDHFWQSELGRVIRHCQLWSQGDNLISHSEAAQMLYGASTEKELMRIKRMIERGELTAYEDPRESNPRHAQRVSKAEVERHK